MENKVNINNNSVEFSGITRDYTEAIAELIWNGFDAGASKVDIVFDTNEIDFIPYIAIIDNGSGINYNDLQHTFGAFLDSMKRGKDQRSSYVRGKKGKGRFSFIAFAQSASWQTVYHDEADDRFYQYEVGINADNKDYYTVNERSTANAHETGTALKLINLFGVSAYSFLSEAFTNFLKHEFGWFLLLNSKHQYQLCINGMPIQYEDSLAEHQVFNREMVDASTTRFSFTITFVRWKEKIGDKFYYYFLNGSKREVFKQLTSFNNNAINFYHSVYVESDYFSHFQFSDEEISENLFGSNPQSPIFRQLVKELQKIVSLQQKAFVRHEAAAELIKKLEMGNSFPTFGLSSVEQEAKQQLIQLIRELYCIQPRIFKGLNDIQEKFTLALIHAYMDRKSALSMLIEQLIPLSDEERQNLKAILN